MDLVKLRLILCCNLKPGSIMKKTLFTLGLAIAATLTLTNCAKQEAIIKDVEPAKQGVPFELVAGIDTKTTAESLSSIKWAANDAIAVFHTAAGSDTYGTNDKFTIAEEDLASNTFKGTVTDAFEASNDWFAFYPYSEYMDPSGSGYMAVGGDMTQDFAHPMAHLAGSKFPLYGKAEGVANGTAPSITMNQAMSIVKVHVTNDSGAPVDVKSVTFATEDYDITGQFYINFSGATPLFSPKNGKTGKSVTLTVTNTTPIADGASADYYIAVPPFDAVIGKKLTLTVNDLSKGITLPAAVSFVPGKVKTLKFNYDKAATPATLPFAITGEDGAAAYSKTDGLSSFGLGSDYGVKNHKPYLTKFDSDGDYVQVFFDKAAYQVSFGVKMIGGDNTSYFYLTGSANGIDFSDIETFTVSGSQNSTQNFVSTADIDPSYRYLRLTFKKGSNVGMGPLSISIPNTDPAISALDINEVPAVGVTNAEWTYTVKNFSDDVEVASVTGCVTDAIAVGGDIVYSVGPNYSTSVATGTIVLWSAADHEVTKTINVSQLRSTLTVSDTEIYIPADATTATFTVTTPEFGYSAVVASTEDGMNLSVSAGASGSANASAQTVTVSSTTEAAASAQTLGTITVYRNGNASDSQKKTITIRKASSSSASWVLTALADIKNTDVFVIVGTNASGSFALSNDKGTSAAPTAVDVTIDGFALSGTIADNIQWTLSKDGGNYTFYPNGTDEIWLYCTNTNNGVRVGTNANKVFTLDTSGYLKHTATSRFVGIYNSQDWRCYTSSTANNIKDQTFSFYVKSE